MTETHSTDKAQSQPATPSDADLPPGDHPLEIAARRGIGPLSPIGKQTWHGNTQPCVSCGQLVTRGAEQCYACDQDLSEGMLRKMADHAGPWYVFDHVRPFPGVSLDRIVRQIRRGVLTETSIVRGPATNYQWRFAGETPGLCRYYGWCWRCYEAVSPADVQCKSCRSPLAFESNQTQPKGRGWGGPTLYADNGGLPPPAPPGEHLHELAAALESGELPAHDPVREAPPRVGRFPVAWITTILLLVVIVALIGFSRIRARDGEGTTPVEAPTVQPTANVPMPADDQPVLETPNPSPKRKRGVPARRGG